MATPVYHGNQFSFSISPYNVVQHHFDPVENENGLAASGFLELLEFVNGPANIRFIVHLLSRKEGSSYFACTSLRHAEAAYKRCLEKQAVCSRDLYSLEGCFGWEQIGHRLPWFYNKAEVDIAAML